MARYCCITTLPDWKNVVDKMYSNLTVEIEEGGAGNEQEVCIVTRDRSEHFLSVNKMLGQIPGFIEPFFVPSWDVITENVGPFIAEDHFIQTIFNVTNKKTGQPVAISKKVEILLTIYARFPDKNKLFLENFSRSFKQLTGLSLLDVDISPFLKSTSQIPVPDYDTYGHVRIDGVKTNLSIFSTPITFLIATGPNIGNIRPGVRAEDVVVNSPVKVPGFTTINAPGASWAAKWKDYTGKVKYSFILFDDDDELSEHGSIESKSTVSEASMPSQYASEPGTPSRSLSSVDSEQNEQYDRMKALVFEDYPEWIGVEMEAESDLPIRKDFINLSDREQLLPISYVLPVADQWRIILIALTSNFRTVSRLPYVSDHVLSLVSDTIAYAIHFKKNVPPSSYSLLEYANAREV